MFVLETFEWRQYKSLVAIIAAKSAKNLTHNESRYKGVTPMWSTWRQNQEFHVDDVSRRFYRTVSILARTYLEYLLSPTNQSASVTWMIFSFLFSSSNFLN